MRLLVLSAWFPFPADNGSKIRTHHLLRALAAEHEVDLIAFYREARELAALREAQALCRQVAAFPKPAFDAERLPCLGDLLSPLPRFVRTTYCTELAKKTEEWRAHNDYHAVICMTWGMAPYLMSDAIGPAGGRVHRPEARCSTRAILDQHNIESGIFRRGLRQSRGARRLRSWLTYQKFRRFEGRACAGFAACSVVSEQERAELNRILPRSASTRIVTIPNGVDTAWLRPRRDFTGQQAGRRRLVFTGSLSYGANLEGLRWFLRTIYPRLKVAYPGIELRISGETWPGAVPEAEGDPAVVFAGYLEDLRPLLRGSEVLIAPLRLGGGTRLKILDAMAAGLPVVSTSVGAEGLQVEARQHLLIADEPEAFAGAVGCVLDQPLRALAMAGRARKLVEREYDWGPIGRSFTRLVEEVAG